MSMISPVMKPANGDTRNRTTWANSHGSVCAAALIAAAGGAHRSIHSCAGSFLKIQVRPGPAITLR